MPEVSLELFHNLAEFHDETAELSAVPCSIKTFFCRKGGESLIGWGFQFSGGGTLPRGYLESIQQRLELFERINWPELNIPVVLSEESGDEFVLHCQAAEGEPLQKYLARLEKIPEGIAIQMMIDVMGFVLPLTGAPRVLSNVELEDFRVFACDGIRLAVRFCPAFSVLRLETPLSDYQIARKWTELMARLLTFIKQNGRCGFEGITPGDSKPFRSLLRDLEAGREKGLVERIQQIIHLLECELDQVPVGRKRLEFAISSREMPLGPFANYLRSGFARKHSGSVSSRRDGLSPGLCFSPFVVEASSGGEKSDRLGYLLPPEHWFETSLVDPVNRRLSHPFLKSHHNSVRVRSVYCDEEFTVLLGDLSPGLPLPSLLRVFDGISREELLLISGKLHRAMEQFESAGFEFPLLSPWQVEIHPESGSSADSWESLLNGDLSAWPPWEVKFRVEPPAESIIDGECGLAWRRVLKRLSGKFIPALVVWMLDWQRFQCPSRTGSLEMEPLNRDARLEALFKAAGDHFDGSNPAHREKFFSLLSEGLEVGKTE